MSTTRPGETKSDNSTLPTKIHGIDIRPLTSAGATVIPFSQGDILKNTRHASGLCLGFNLMLFKGLARNNLKDVIGTFSKPFDEKQIEETASITNSAITAAVQTEGEPENYLFSDKNRKQFIPPHEIKKTLKQNGSTLLKYLTKQGDDHIIGFQHQTAKDDSDPTKSLHTCILFEPNRFFAFGHNLQACRAIRATAQQIIDRSQPPIVTVFSNPPKK